MFGHVVRTQLNEGEKRYRRLVIRWHGTHGRIFPWRDESDRYAVLIGEVLLQRTRGEHVLPVYSVFLSKWPTPPDLAKARVSAIARVIRPLGLPRRAVMLKQLGQALARLPEVPNDPDTLLKLPGIGPYAARAVPVFADGLDLPLVDWVIARVLRRYFGLAEGRRPNADPETWAMADRLASPGRAREVWLGTLDLAAAVCRPVPLCQVCPLASSCRFVSRPSES